VYEAAVAAGAIAMGDVPGDAPEGEWVFVAAAVGALLAATALACSLLFGRATRASTLVLLLPVGGLAFVLGRWYAYDPYYLPTLRRASEGGLVAGGWIVVVVVAAVAGAALTASARLRRLGLCVSVAALLAELATAVAVRGGH
jgi:hypothetical protein